MGKRKSLQSQADFVKKIREKEKQIVEEMKGNLGEKVARTVAEGGSLDDPELIAELQAMAEVLAPRRKRGKKEVPEAKKQEKPIFTSPPKKDLEEEQKPENRAGKFVKPISDEDL